MLKIIDRYIIKEILEPFLFGVMAFSFILAGGTILLPLVSDAIKYDIPTSAVLQLLLFQMPQVIVYTFPMSILLATLMALGRLNSNLEILAFRASGINFLRIIRPILILGFIISIATILFNESIVPKSSYKALVLFKSFRESDTPKIKENINFTEYKNGLPFRIINVKEVDEGTLLNITVAEYDEGELVRLIRSDSGKWMPSGGWVFYNGIMHNFQPDNKKTVTLIEFEEEFINIAIDPFKSPNKLSKTETLSARELKEEIDTLKQMGRNVRKEIMDYYMKFSIPFASLIFSLLASAVAFQHHRSSSAMGFGIALVIIFFYYILIAFSTSLGISNTIPPMLAAWLPNIITGLIGVIRLRNITSK